MMGQGQGCSICAQNNLIENKNMNMIHHFMIKSAKDPQIQQSSNLFSN
jgi:hypothetical protein